MKKLLLTHLFCLLFAAGFAQVKDPSITKDSVYNGGYFYMKGDTIVGWEDDFTDNKISHTVTVKSATQSIGWQGQYYTPKNVNPYGVKISQDSGFFVIEGDSAKYNSTFSIGHEKVPISIKTYPFLKMVIRNDSSQACSFAVYLSAIASGHTTAFLNSKDSVTNVDRVYTVKAYTTDTIIVNYTGYKYFVHSSTTKDWPCPNSLKNCGNLVSLDSITNITLKLNYSSTPYYGKLYIDKLLLGNTQDTTLIVAGVTKQASFISFSNIYPNPAKDQLNLELNLSQPSNIKVTLNDMVGRQLSVLAEGPLTTITKNIDVSTLPRGMYTVAYFIDGVPAGGKLVVIE